MLQYRTHVTAPVAITGPRVVLSMEGRPLGTGHRTVMQQEQYPTGFR